MEDRLPRKLAAILYADVAGYSGLTGEDEDATHRRLSEYPRELYGDKFDPEKMANTSDVAEAFWLAYQQPKSVWSNKVELRPYTEVWTY